MKIRLNNIPFQFYVIVALLMISVVPRAFQMTRILAGNVPLNAMLYRIEKLIFLFLIFHLFDYLVKRFFSIPYVLKFAFFFFLVFIGQAARNLFQYGWGTFQEFEGSYMALFLPVYVGIFFRTARDRKILFKLVMGVMLFPLLLWPLVAFLKVGSTNLVTYESNNRFFSSLISLGLVYSMVHLFLGQKYGHLVLTKKQLIVIAVLALLVIFIDSHRSVWMTGMLILFLLGVFKEVKLFSFKVIFRTAAGVVAMIGLMTVIGIDVAGYFVERASAFVNPSEDGTSLWRLMLWQAYWQEFLESPWFGQGLGGFWSVYVPFFGTELGFSPHNLYIQILVKTGVFGLATYALYIGSMIYTMVRWLKKQKNKPLHPERFFVISGVIFLIAISFYHIVYALDILTYLFVGLAMAVVIHEPSAPVEEIKEEAIDA